MAQPKKEYSAEERKAAIAAYSETGSITRAAEIVGVSGQWALAERFREWGVPINPHGGRKRTTKINDLAFSGLSPEILYWAGFLLADGNVFYQKRKYHGNARVGLKLKDREHIEKFKAFLDTDYAITEIHEDGRIKYSIYVLSTPIAVNLERFGIVPNKTFDVAIPGDNPDILFSRDFWRGYVDGDGHIGWQQKKRGLSARFGLFSTSTRILEQFNLFLQQYNLDCLAIHKKKGERVHYISAHAEKARDIVSLLYSGSVVYLDRKYKRAAKLLYD